MFHNIPTSYVREKTIKKSDINIVFDGYQELNQQQLHDEVSWIIKKGIILINGNFM